MAVLLLLVSILALLSDGLADDGTQDLKQLELGTGNESGCYDQLMSEISDLRQALSEEVSNRKEVNEEVNNLKKAVGRQKVISRKISFSIYGGVKFLLPPCQRSIFLVPPPCQRRNIPFINIRLEK